MPSSGPYLRAENVPEPAGPLGGLLAFLERMMGALFNAPRTRDTRLNVTALGLFIRTLNNIQWLIERIDDGLLRPLRPRGAAAGAPPPPRLPALNLYLASPRRTPPKAAAPPRNREHRRAEKRRQTGPA